VFFGNIFGFEGKRFIGKKAKDHRERCRNEVTWQTGGTKRNQSK
jgi:hypothetical protein